MVYKKVPTSFRNYKSLLWRKIPGLILNSFALFETIFVHRNHIYYIILYTISGKIPVTISGNEWDLFAFCVSRHIRLLCTQNAKRSHSFPEMMTGIFPEMVYTFMGGGLREAQSAESELRSDRF